MTARAVAHALFRYRRMMLAVMLVAVTLGGAMAVLHQPRWRAEATLLVESRRPDAARALAALFESRDLHREVVEKLGDRLYPLVQVHDRAAAFARDLSVKPVTDAALVRVSFDGPSAEDAAGALAALMDGVRARNAMVFSIASGEQSGRAAEDARQRLAEFRKKTGIVDSRAEREALVGRRAELEGQLVAAETETGTLTDRLAMLKAKLAVTPATIATETQSERTRVVDEARAKLFDLQTREQELLGKYNETSVFVQRAREERRKVQQLLDQMMATSDTRVTQGTNPIHQEIEKEIVRAEAALTSAKARSRTVTRQLAELDRRFELVAGAETRLRELEGAARAADVGAGEGGGRAVEAIGIVQAAAAGSQPVGPGRIGLVAIAAAAGLVVAVLLALLAHRFSPRFSTPADVERRLGLPVLTTIPRES